MNVSAKKLYDIHKQHLPHSNKRLNLARKRNSFSLDYHVFIAMKIAENGLTSKGKVVFHCQPFKHPLYFIYAHKTYVIVRSSIREKIYENNKEFLSGNWYSFLFSDNEETDGFLMLFFPSPWASFRGGEVFLNLGLWGGGGGLIFHSAMCLPLFKFPNMPFALFIGTSKPFCNSV